MKKICSCGYETDKKNFDFCPSCGNKLRLLELEEDGTYKAERNACRIIDHDWMNPNEIYYYKVSPIDKELVWIYKSPVSAHWILGCHISKVKPLEVERIKRCSFRKNNECGHIDSCKICPVYRGNIDNIVMKFVNIVKQDKL